MFKSVASAITSFARFLRDDNGATAIEYALIASGVSIVIVGTITVIGTNVVSLYTNVNTALK